MSPPITVDHLPDRLDGPPPHPHTAPRTRHRITLRELEAQAIDEALERHQGNKPAAAEELGISLKTLYNKLNQASNLEKSA